MTLDMNVDALIDFFKNVHRFSINLSNDPKYLGWSLFLFFEKSPVKIEENKESTLKHFPNDQFYVFKGGFHTFHVEFPELFTNVVSKFIEE
ncbi:hypothetical protein HNY73_020835 [Argiope bruennichi]|uniref:Uncharacterized protein n=1 Tax=Argiope bruennichi TaxID=94029 RepID=A0A8T0E9E9_ARGBR|nr:hypothetical protein HNY73_020835 [Argiope bruennichi]